MSTSILERIRDALACPVEHPVPIEIFSPFETFNPMTMEVVGDLSDDEIRIVRLMNELGVMKMSLQSELRTKEEKSEDYELLFKRTAAEMDFAPIGDLLIASLFRRFYSQSGGDYRVASNGKVIRMRKISTVTQH